MGGIYKGFGLSRTQVGEYEDGIIYSGHGLGREIIGSYDQDCIYDESKSIVGKYYDGQIFSGTGFGASQIGEYSNGAIYSDWGLSKSQVGEYTGGPAGAAAYLLLNLASLPSPSSIASSSSVALGTYKKPTYISTQSETTIFDYIYSLFIIICFVFCIIMYPKFVDFINKYEFPIVFIIILIIFFLSWKKCVKSNFTVLLAAAIYSLITFGDYILYKVIVCHFFNELNLVLNENYFQLFLCVIIYSIITGLTAYIIYFCTNTAISFYIYGCNNIIIVAFLLLKGFFNEIHLILITDIGFFEAFLVKPVVFIITLAWYIFCYTVVLFIAHTFMDEN